MGSLKIKELQIICSSFFVYATKNALIHPVFGIITFVFMEIRLGYVNGYIMLTNSTLPK